MTVVPSDTSDTDVDPCENEVGRSSADKEVPLSLILEKLVVSAFARSLVDVPPGVIKLGVDRPVVVKLTDAEGREKPLVDSPDETEGKSGDRLVDGTFEGREELPVDRVASTRPKSDVPSVETPGNPDGLDVKAATEVASGVPSDTL
jgi:hypothetical protein